MEELKEKARNAWDLLPHGGKQLAADIMGRSKTYLQDIANGLPKNEDVYHLFLAATKQAAKQMQTKVNDQVRQIEVITEEINHENI